MFVSKAISSGLHALFPTLTLQPAAHSTPATRPQPQSQPRPPAGSDLNSDVSSDTGSDTVRWEKIVNARRSIEDGSLDDRLELALDRLMDDLDADRN